MAHDKPEFDILAKIERERIRRKWTVYNLAQNSGIAQSTISTWYRRRLQPNVASIEKICGGLGMTLSEFFMDESSGTDGGTGMMTNEQKELKERWDRLSPTQKDALLGLIRSFEKA